MARGRKKLELGNLDSDTEIALTLYWFHIQNIPREKIAEALKKSPSQISRNIQRGKDKGWLDQKLSPDALRKVHAYVENQYTIRLKEKFSKSKVNIVVVLTENMEEQKALKHIYETVAISLKILILELAKQTKEVLLGVTWGWHVRNSIQALISLPLNKYELECLARSRAIPLIGDMLIKNQDMQINSSAISMGFNNRFSKKNSIFLSSPDYYPYEVTQDPTLNDAFSKLVREYIPSFKLIYGEGGLSEKLNIIFTGFSSFKTTMKKCPFNLDKREEHVLMNPSELIKLFDRNGIKLTENFTIEGEANKERIIRDRKEEAIREQIYLVKPDKDIFTFYKVNFISSWRLNTQIMSPNEWEQITTKWEKTDAGDDKNFEGEAGDLGGIVYPYPPEHKSRLAETITSRLIGFSHKMLLDLKEKKDARIITLGHEVEKAHVLYSILAAGEDCPITHLVISSDLAQAVLNLC